MSDPGQALGRQITRLDNGIRVVSDSIPSVESVSLGAWFGVGSRNEVAETNGVAHFLEHMAFKGTARRSATDIAEEVESVGGHLNAYTAREQTAYFARVLKENSALAVDVLADILQHSLFEEDELARERTVILQEIGQAADTPDDVVFDLFQQTAYPDQALGWPILGQAEVVGAMPRHTITDFVDRHYGSDQMVFSAAGNIAHERLVGMVEAGFRDFAPKTAAPVTEARYAGGETRQSRDLEQVHVVLGFPGVPYHDPDFYAQQVLSTVLGGGMSSRLFQEIRERRGLVYAIYSMTTAYRDAGLFGIYAGTGEHDVAELIPVVCDELAGFADSDLDEEVARARTQLRSNLLMSREATSVRCEQTAQQLLIFDRVIEVDELIDQVNAIDSGAVRRVMRRILSNRPTLAAVGPLSRLEPYERLCRRLS